MATPYIGEIRVFGGTFAPVGWHLCDGSSLDISIYQVLYSLIGTTYGGNGTTNFNVPDLRGRAIISEGQLTGGSNYPIGQLLGTENVTITTGQMPPHPHGVGGLTGPGSVNSPSNQVLPAASTATNPAYDGTGGTMVSLAPQSVTTAGGNLPHDNRQPYLAITYIIALEGVYPPHA